MTYVEPAVSEAIDQLDAEIARLFGVKPATVLPASTSKAAAPAQGYTYPQATGYSILLNYMRGNFGLTQLDPTIPVSQWRFDVETAIYVADLANYSQQIAISSQDGLAGAKSYTQAVLGYIQAGLTQATAGSSQQAIAVAEQLYNAAVGKVNAEAVARAQGDARVTERAASYANSAEAAAKGYAYARTHSLGVALTGEQHARAQGDAHAVAVAATLANQAEGRSNARTDTLVAGVRSDLSSDVTVLEQKITNGVNTAEGVAAKLADAAGANAVAQAVAQVAPTLDRVATEVDTCLAPLCDTVTPNAKQLGNLGKYLKGFEGLGIAALLASLVAEAVIHPEPAAEAITAAGGWLDSVAVELVDAVTGG